MPYRWRPWYRRRRRRLWRWRARKAFRRRYRRRRPVRRFKRKLKKIIVREWQPTTINKLKIRGDYPLFQGNRERTTNNLNQYLTSIAPSRFPGGGLWSTFRFSLLSLYELHRKARNWWTKSNCKLPLIKYIGCRIKLFRSLNTDYIFVYSRCGSMEANLDTYQSAQPSILNLNNNKVIVTCDNGVRNKKPYKKIFIKPPVLMQNKWYFQRDIAKLPLFMAITASCSLNRWYTSSKAENNTIGFASLNTELFVYHNFRDPPITTGYVPNDNFTLWTYPQGVNIRTCKWKNLIYLANTKDFTRGITIEDAKSNLEQAESKVNAYFSDIKNWGNIFIPYYFHPDFPDIITTDKGLEWVKQQAKTHYDQPIEGFTNLSQPLYWECRYNPEADLSHNGVYITNIYGPKRPWENPAEDKLKTEGLPLWLLLHGFTDYHAVAKDIQALMTDHIVAIVSEYIDPPRKSYYVPIDRDFLKGQSPFEHQHRKPFDELYWYPKLNFQQRTLNGIVTSGPGTPKLPPEINAEAKMQYEFLFKLGGCPPPMDDVCDPLKSAKFPTASNFLPSTLLQNPEMPIEYYLSTFDERRGMLTERAAKRIKTHKDFTETLFDIAGQTSTTVPARAPETSSDETSEEEKDQTEIQLDIHKQRRKQKKLRYRILQLLKLTENL